MGRERERLKERESERHTKPEKLLKIDHNKVEQKHPVFYLNLILAKDP